METWLEPESACRLAGGILLAVNSIKDLKKHEIFFFPTVAAGVCGAVLRITGGITVPAELMAASLPGLILEAVSFFTCGKVGIGDGILFLALAMWNDTFRMWMLLPASLVIAAAGGLILNRMDHKKQGRGRETEIPYVPCIFAAYILIVIF
ncbi:MAG: hypothetical protein U0L49_02325 [Eubacterium sp.]|nr:hypothetical protein [Eubacterium sp.]